MGLNMDGLNPEQKKLINEAIKDGQLSPEEKLKLEKAGINEELIKKLSGKDSEEPGKHDLAKSGLWNKIGYLATADGKGFFNRAGNLTEKEWDYVTDGDVPLWDKVKTGAKEIGQWAIAAAAPFIAVAGGGKVLALAATVGGKVKILATAVGAIVGFTACTDKADDTPSKNAVINNDIDVGVLVTVQGNYEEMAKYVKELIELKKQGQAADAARHAELMSKLDALIQEQKNQGETITKILLEMKNQGLTLDIIVTILQDQGHTLKAITEALAEICKNDEEIINILKASGADTKAILEALNENNRITGKNQELLKEILAKLKDYGDDDTETNKLLNAILNKLADFEKQEFKMDEKTHELLQALLALGETSVNLQVEGFDKIIDKLNEIIGKMPDGCKCDATVIVQKLQEIIDKLHDNDSTNDPKNESILDDLDDYFG